MVAPFTETTFQFEPLYIKITLSPTALNKILDGTLVEFKLPFDCVIVALLPATVIIIIFLWPTKRPAARVSDAVPLPVFRSYTSVSLSNALEPPAPVMVSVDEP